jgi:hypothetical protein
MPSHKFKLRRAGEFRLFLHVSAPAPSPKPKIVLLAYLRLVTVIASCAGACLPRIQHGDNHMSGLAWIALAVILGAFVLEWKLGDIQKEFKEVMRERAVRLDEKLDATLQQMEEAVDQLDRIAGILGGMLAEMPHLPSKGDPYLDAMRRREK